MLLFERLDERISLGGRRFGADQRGFAVRQQAVDLAGVLDGGGEDHHAFAIVGVLYNLADDMRRDAVLPFQLTVQVRFAEQAVAPGLQTAEVVLHDRHIQPLRRHQKTVFNHVAQRQLIDAVAKQTGAVAAGETVVVVLVNPAFAQPVRRGGQPQQPQLRVGFLQVLDDLLVLAVVVVADAMAFIDDQQRKGAVEQRQVARHRLHAAEHHLAGALFLLQPGGEDVRLQAVGAVFCVVLRHQFLDVRQHQHSPTGAFRQLGDHQAFAGAGRQHDQRRLGMPPEMVDGGFDRFQLVGA
ncbi:Uncharacterised protein [Acinetobacter baumannii]|nr:Uncharacterised protein [Acinetobacter baumannii]